MNNSKHLTLHDRLKIEGGLANKKTIYLIAQDLQRSPSTISREIKRHMQVTKKCGSYVSFNDCIHRFECVKNKKIKKSKTWGECIKHCSNYKKENCLKRDSAPYVCNGCKRRVTCSLEKRYYYSLEAQEQYKQVLKESRKGLAITEKDLFELKALICPLLEKGQSFHHIYENHKNEISVSERVLYQYLHRGLFDLPFTKLPRIVRYKQRHIKNRYAVKIDKKCYINRTYLDYKEFMKENPDSLVVQLDTVEGVMKGSVLLTIHFLDSSLMLGFYREKNNAQSVIDIFNRLYKLLEIDDFKKLFPVILTDRGTEFTNPSAIELAENGEIRTRIFFCDPMCSWQKGGCEVNHEFIRRIKPKGNSLNTLSQKDIDLMMNHINSYNRKKLGNRSPYEIFKELYGLEIAKKLGIKLISPDEIVLKPSLLK